MTTPCSKTDDSQITPSFNLVFAHEAVQLKQTRDPVRCKCIAGLRRGSLALGGPVGGLARGSLARGG